MPPTGPPTGPQMMPPTMPPVMQPTMPVEALGMQPGIQPGMQPMAAPRRPRVAVIALSVALVLFAAGVGVLLSLYLNQRSTSESLSQQLSSTKQSLQQANSDLSNTKSQLSQSNDQLTQSNNQLATMKAANGNLTTCVNALHAFLLALNTVESDGFSAASVANAQPLAQAADTDCGF